MQALSDFFTVVTLAVCVHVHHLNAPVRSATAVAVGIGSLTMWESAATLVQLLSSARVDHHHHTGRPAVWRLRPAFKRLDQNGRRAARLSLQLSLIVTFLMPGSKADSFYPRDAMLERVFATATCPSVRLSVCLSHAGIVPSRAKAGSWNVHHLIAPWF